MKFVWRLLFVSDSRQDRIHFHIHTAAKEYSIIWMPLLWAMEFNWYKIANHSERKLNNVGLLLFGNVFDFSHVANISSKFIGILIVGGGMNGIFVWALNLVIYCDDDFKSELARWLNNG